MKRKSQLGGFGSNPSHRVNLAGDLRNSWFFRDLRRKVRNNRQPIMNTTSASLWSGKMSTKSSSWRNFTTTSSNQNRGDAPSLTVPPISQVAPFLAYSCHCSVDTELIDRENNAINCINCILIGGEVYRQFSSSFTFQLINDHCPIPNLPANVFT